MGLSDRLTYTHTRGVHDTKAQFLGSLTLGQLSYKSIIPEDRSVRVSLAAGGVAIHACTRRIGGVPGRLWPSSPLLSAPGPPVLR